MENVTPATPPAKKKETLKGCLGIFVILVFIVFIFKMCSGGSSVDTSNFTPAQKDSAERKELIKKQFSSYDGSHYNLVKYVKESMNDPKSFEHVETVYYDFKKKITIEMTFRGKNGFGALVKQKIIADADINGNILSANMEK